MGINGNISIMCPLIVSIDNLVDNMVNDMVNDMVDNMDIINGHNNIVWI